MKRFALLLTLIILPALTFAQVRYVGPLSSWQAQPCSWQAGELAFATDAVTGANLYVCTFNGIWSQVGGILGGALTGGLTNPSLRDFVSVKDYGASGAIGGWGMQCI